MVETIIACRFGCTSRVRSSSTNLLRDEEALTRKKLRIKTSI
jgi:hypothetical protein